jgi:NADPH-dependent 2,4-dienoyl-CoA reductase/sulfur reductase-like enzyme
MWARQNGRARSWWSVPAPPGWKRHRVSAERGHEVIVLEAAAQAGGQVLLARQASWRKDITGLVDWRVAELETLGVEVRYNTFAEPEDVSALSILMW